jgi:hypothetical protein
LLLEADCFLGCGNPFVLGLLFGARRGGLLGLALMLCRGLLALSFSPCLVLGFLAVTLYALVALLRCDFRLQASTLDLGLGFLGLKRRFGVTLLRFGSLCFGLGLCVNLSLLQAALPGQIVVSNQRSGGFLRLAGKPANQAARGLLRSVLIGQNRSFLLWWIPIGPALDTRSGR